MKLVPLCDVPELVIGDIVRRRKGKGRRVVAIGKDNRAERRSAPNADVVEHLESMLERAKKGEIRAVSVVYVLDPTHTFGTAYAGDVGTRNTLIAGAFHAMRRMDEEP